MINEVCYIYNNGLLFGNRKEWQIDTYNNTNESWKPYAPWKKLIMKDHIT